MSVTQVPKPLLLTKLATRNPLYTLSTATSARPRPAFARSLHPTLSKMTVHNIETVDAFRDVIARKPVVVVDWFATWCGPCKSIAPQLVRWSESIPEIYFAKVDVDALPDLAQQYNVRAMPTFHIFKAGQQVDEFVSANPPALLQIIEKWKAAAGQELAGQELAGQAKAA